MRLVYMNQIRAEQENNNTYIQYTTDTVNREIFIIEKFA